MAQGLQFERKGEKITLHPKNPVRYIIVGTPNKEFPKPIRTVHIGEVMAYGEKLGDVPEFVLPKDDRDPYENYHKVSIKIT